MERDRRPDQLSASTPRKARRRRDRQQDHPVDTGLHVTSLDRSVTISAALNNAEILELLGEDCSWQLARADWEQRRPPLWHRAERRAWRTEGRALEEKSQRLRELGATLGLPARAPTRRSRFDRDDR